MFFKRSVLAKVALPREQWEPLRKLHDEHGVDLETLASCWAISESAMLRVLYAARLTQLENGEEVSWFDELGAGGSDADAVPASC